MNTLEMLFRVVGGLFDQSFLEQPRRAPGEHSVAPRMDVPARLFSFNRIYNAANDAMEKHCGTGFNGNAGTTMAAPATCEVDRGGNAHQRRIRRRRLERISCGAF